MAESVGIKMEDALVTGRLTELTAPFLESDYLMAAVGFLIVVFVVFYLMMTSSYSRVIKGVKGNLDDLLEGKEFAELARKTNNKVGIDSLRNRGVKGFPSKGLLSKEFSLIEANLIHFDGDVSPQLPTGLTNHLFKSEEIEYSHVTKGVINRGGLFTTLGVLGTFIGLTIGVASAATGLASSDITIARIAMGDLLEGAQFAFITSLLGLLLTLIYNTRLGFKRKELKRVADELSEWVDYLFPPISPPLVSAMQSRALLEKMDVLISLNKDMLEINRFDSGQIGEANLNLKALGSATPSSRKRAPVKAKPIKPVEGDQNHSQGKPVVTQDEEGELDAKQV